MSSTCFEPKGSSTGRRLCMQLWYGMFYLLKLQYKRFYKISKYKMLNFLNISI